MNNKNATQHNTHLAYGLEVRDAGLVNLLVVVVLVALPVAILQGQQRQGQLTRAEGGGC